MAVKTYSAGVKEYGAVRSGKQPLRITARFPSTVIALYWFKNS